MIDFAFGFLCGALCLVQFTWFAHKRFIKRIGSIDADELVAQELERRRETIDYGRSDEVVDGAGPSGDVHELFQIRPGTMTLDHLSEKKLPKDVDSQQI